MAAEVTAAAAVASTATISSAASTIASAKSSTAAIGTVEVTTESSASTAKASTTAKSSTTTEAAATAKAASVSVAVLANFKDATLPVVAVEVADGVLSVFCSLECDDTGALGRAIWSGVDVCACDVASLTEQVLQILPADGEWELRSVSDDLVRRAGCTNVGDEDLASRSTLHAAAVHATVHTAAVHTAVHTHRGTSTVRALESSAAAESTTECSALRLRRA